MRQPTCGTIFLVVDQPSNRGAAFLAAVRRLLGDDPGVVFPRRIIASPTELGSEVYQAVTPAQFAELRRGGSFALAWSERGGNFALPAHILDDLAQGRDVVAAAPSVMLPAAAEKFAHVVAVVTGNAPAKANAAGPWDVLSLEQPSPAAAAVLAERLRAGAPHQATAWVPAGTGATAAVTTRR